MHFNSVSARISRYKPGRVSLLAFFIFYTFLCIETARAEYSGVAPESLLWQALQRGDHFAMLRHATAPGIGDPANFAIGDCTTQRNLSEAGREQARRIGVRFRENGITDAEVFSSQWCRCHDTAELLGLGAVTGLPVLNSFFRNNEREEQQTAELRRWLAASDTGKPLLLVTHQVNITAITGVFPDPGELVIVRRAPDGTLAVAGTIQTD